MRGGGRAKEARIRRQGVPHFNTLRGGILTLYKPRTQCETLTKINVISPPKESGERCKARAVVSRKKAPRGLRR